METGMASTSEWVLAEPDDQTVDQLTREIDCHSSMAQVLAAQGYTDPTEAKTALDPSLSNFHMPDALPDISRARDRLESALTGDEHIAVYADRDVDGISGAAILVGLLDDLDASVTHHIPGKYDGYGFHMETVEQLAKANTDLIVTVDCGTTAHEEIQHARSSGIDVIVTDHHHPEETLPPAVACVNPRREDSPYAHENLAGGAVAFKLGHAIVDSYAPHLLQEYLQLALPLTAMATLGDYMPLNLENRALVSEGYDRFYESGLTGLTVTAEHVGVESMRDIGWSLVPLLNAAEEDESGDLMLDLLLASDTDAISEKIATIEGYREKRREERAEQLDHLRECFAEQVEPPDGGIIIVETREYVGGYAMSQLSSEWGRPVITYREKNDRYQGGGRTDPDIDLVELFEACEDRLESLWGHPGAAGFEVTSEHLDGFFDQLREEFKRRYDQEDLRPSIDIVGRLEPDSLTQSFVNEIERLRPFGNGNPEPVFLMEDIELVSYETFGDDGVHCRLEPAEHDGFGVLYWNGAEEFGKAKPPGIYDVVGNVGYDSYRNQPTFEVEDFKVRNSDNSV